MGSEARKRLSSLLKLRNIEMITFQYIIFITQLTKLVAVYKVYTPV